MTGKSDYLGNLLKLDNKRSVAKTTTKMDAIVKKSSVDTEDKLSTLEAVITVGGNWSNKEDGLRMALNFLLMRK